MNVPIRFREKLKSDLNLENAVNEAIINTSNIINAVVHMEFFPEYTKHDLTHIENVLVTSDNLITDDSFTNLSANDIAVLILSTLFHDIGMFINDRGLQSLLNNCYNETVNYFDDLSWYELWNNFFDEAKRYDIKKLNALFGENFPGIEEPPQNSSLWNKYHKMLYGEFLRRYHSRLAHEIALYGFPGVDGKLVKIVDGIDSNIINLSGLVARSHGMNVRDTFNYLKMEYGEFCWDSYKDIKVVFLMTVLRIADYLHFTPDRVPVLEKHLFKHSSHISLSEKELHDSIDYVTPTIADSEAIYVHANPKSSIMYLKIEELLKSIQNEFDISWAVIGEVYGRICPNLKLTKRRIISNIIDDKKNFTTKLKYIPEKVIFDADPDLLKLLIKPLYGNNPSYGIRELIQNSVDACKECDLLLKNKVDYEPKVIIEIRNDDNGYFIKIADNGIGMTKDVLINYFLRAGATYRNSQSWRKNFTDNKGKSIVRKSGRFGIGVLASFIIGKEINVRTKQINSNKLETLEFTASIYDDQIEITKAIDSDFLKQSGHGTIIEIKIDANTFETLKQDIYIEQRQDNKNGLHNDLWFKWYRFDNPKICFQLPLDWPNINKEDLISEESLIEGLEWNTINHKGFNMINWKNSRENLLICNGFIVPEGYDVDRQKVPLLNYLPQISIYDYDGNLPFALNRKRLEDKLPFEDELLEDICKDRIAKLLMEKHTCRITDSFITIDQYNYTHPTITNIDGIIEYSKVIQERCKKDKLIFTNKGYSLMHPYYFIINRPSKLFLFHLSPDKPLKITFQDKGYPVVFYDRLDSFDNEGRLENVILDNSNVEYFSKKYFINKNYSMKAFSPISDTEIKKKGYDIKQIKNWVCVFDKLVNFDFTEKDLCMLNDEIEYFIEYNISYKNENQIINKDLFYKTAVSYLDQDGIIPYSIGDRKIKFQSAFNDLRKYIINYEDR